MFQFIHTADWQIGAPFGHFESHLSSRLTDARLGMIHSIAKAAEQHQSQHVIVAGDVWDNVCPSQNTIVQPIDIMRGYSSITWWLMPGNHDPYKEHMDMLWSKVQAYLDRKKCSHIRLLLTAEPIEAESGVWLLPAPWKSKSAGKDEDLTTWMNKVQVPASAIKIGIAHGSIYKFDKDTSAIIDPNRAISANLDYLALGDWHGCKCISPKTWYSGTPETDRFKDNKSGYVLAVTIEKNTAPKVDELPITSFHWHMIDIKCVPRMPYPQKLRQLKELHSLKDHLIQVRFQGEIDQNDWLEFQQNLTELEQRSEYFELKQDDLIIQLHDKDLEVLPQGGSLRAAAQKLLQITDDNTKSPEERRIAQDALQLLLGYNRKEAQL